MTFARLRAALNPRRWTFSALYWRGRTPWDTGVTPPELRAAVEGAKGSEGAAAEPPGRALDLGCGTGLNSVYLAEHGWEVVGCDFAAPAIRRARRRLRMANTLAERPLAARFVRADATRLRAAGVRGPFTLLLDLGCLHTIPRAGRARYAEEVVALAAPGALYLLYAFTAESESADFGLTEAELDTLFGESFRLERIERGSDARGARASAWRWLRHDPSA